MSRVILPTNWELSMSECQTKIGYVLLQYRRASHQTIDAMAKSMGLTRKAYSDLEREQNVTGATLAAALRWLLSPYSTQIFAKPKKRKKGR